MQTPKELPDITIQKPLVPPMIPKEQQPKEQVEQVPTLKEPAPMYTIFMTICSNYIGVNKVLLRLILPLVFFSLG